MLTYPNILYELVHTAYRYRSPDCHSQIYSNKQYTNAKHKALCKTKIIQDLQFFISFSMYFSERLAPSYLGLAYFLFVETNIFPKVVEIFRIFTWNIPSCFLPVKITTCIVCLHRIFVIRINFSSKVHVMIHSVHIVH